MVLSAIGALACLVGVHFFAWQQGYDRGFNDGIFTFKSERKKVEEEVAEFHRRRLP